DRLREFEPLRRRCARWAKDAAGDLRARDPVIPTGLNDRAADNWRPLLAIAELAGERWAERARSAALLLSGADAETNPGLALQVLADIRDIFSEKGDRLSSHDLVNALNRPEDRPWSDWKDRLTQTALATIIKPYGVKPDSVRLGDKTLKSYRREWFDQV